MSNAVTSTSSSTASSQPTRSLNRQVVLEEDEYTEALSHIIARDFFPSLAHLDATNGYLDALKSNDPTLIQASARRLEDLNTPVTRRSTQTWQTPSQTPYRMGPMETPLRTPRENMGEEPPMKRRRYELDMSLDEFQARYTSEDNSSFTQILDAENKRIREKYAWAWEAQKRVEMQRERMIEQREKLLIEPPPATGVREKFVIEAPEARGLITAGGEKEQNDGRDGVEGREGEQKEQGGQGKEVVIAHKEDVEMDVMAPKKDTRAAGVDGWKFKARNALMFPPDADVSPYHPTIPAKTPEDLKVVPKVIKYGNTRLPEQDDSVKDSISAPPSPTRSRIDAAITGTPYRPSSPKNGSFSLVPSVPTPSPSELGPAAVKQLMTWGTITGTPRILSQSDDPAESSIPPPSTPFRIAEPSSRERLSQKLSADAAKSLRAKAGLLNRNVPGIARTPASSGRKGSMPPPSWTPRKADAVGGLTPAGRRLLDRSAMGTAASRRAEVMGRTAGWEGPTSNAKEKDLNRVRWTPTPSPVTRRGG